MSENLATRRLTRRGFFKLTAGGALALYMIGPRGIEEVFAAPIPGGTVLPGNVPKFVTPLVIPPPMPNTGTANEYAITVKQFSQGILPSPLPQTTVWSYGAANQLGTLNYPAFTIEATRGQQTSVTWINGLVDGSGNYLPHLLPVDPTLHWANPPGGTAERDMRPTFATTPGPYTGPVPLVTHVHGMGNVADWSDGYAEAWYLPDAANIPAGYATVGTWYDFFKTKSGLSWAPGAATFNYPNDERPSTAWYHDHALGMTRLNVYAGPAGFYIIRSNAAADNPTVVGGGAATLPGPAPQFGDGPGTKYYEIPIAIQDRSFNADGSLFYPNSRVFFDGFPGPYIPTTDVSPIWNPEFFGNCMVVNGKTWPFLDVEPRRYRFRLLNGCQARFLLLSFSDPKVQVWQIGAEGGYLRAPVQVKELLMSPAERADVIVDFSQVKQGTSVVLKNAGPDAPFGGGGFRSADPQTTGQVMQFNVTVPLAGTDASTPPAQLVMPAAPSFPAGDDAAPARVARDDVDVTGGATDPGRGPARHVRPGCRSAHRRHREDVAGAGQREPGRWAQARPGSSTTSPPTPTQCTSTRSSSRW